MSSPKMSLPSLNTSINNRHKRFPSISSPSSSSPSSPTSSFDYLAPGSPSLPSLNTSPVQYYQRNDWSRRHGYHRPFDSRLLLQWTFYVSLNLGYFCFLLGFVGDSAREGTVVVGRAAGVLGFLGGFLDGRSGIAQPSAIGDRGTWCIFMLVLSTAIFITSLRTSLIDTQDPRVVAARTPRDLTYVPTAGIPVVYDGRCNICNVHVGTNTRHCKLCNKCVHGLDHHCRWLNCCIGHANYRTFCVLIASTFLAMIIYTVLCLRAVRMYFVDPTVFLERLRSIFAVTPISEHASTAGSLALLLLTGVSVVGTAFLSHLVFFHVRLYFMGMTTVEYINRQRYDYDECDEDENPWKRPFRSPSSKRSSWRRQFLGTLRRIVASLQKGKTAAPGNRNEYAMMSSNFA